MPYNTRRKSLSLTELGITLPKRSRAHSQSSPSNTTTIVEQDERPVKKSKLSAPSASPPPPRINNVKSPARNSVTTTTIRFKEEKPGLPAQLSPPPSPVTDDTANRVDVEGINDDIVVATIRQLEHTGNRPLLVKELAAILSTSLDSAEKYATNRPSLRDVRQRGADILTRSTNPSALISSRLTAYINRHWPAVCPCPLAKDLTTAHPRRSYFYLTTLPRRTLPPGPVSLPARNGHPHHGTISPSLSSAEGTSSSSSDVSDDENEARLLRQRQALSPSPEVDLSSPDLYIDAPEQPPTPGAPFSGRSSLAPAPSERSASGAPTSLLAPGGRLRGGSPQLENEERDFKLTATAVYEEERKRRNDLLKQEEEERASAARSPSSFAPPSLSASPSIEHGNTNGASSGAGLPSSDPTASLPSESSSFASSPTSAEMMQKMDFEMSSAQPNDSLPSTDTAGLPSVSHMKPQYDDVDEEGEQRQNREVAAALFGSEHLAQHDRLLRSPEMHMLGFSSSPLIAPRKDLNAPDDEVELESTSDAPKASMDELVESKDLAMTCEKTGSGEPLTSPTPSDKRGGNEISKAVVGPQLRDGNEPGTAMKEDEVMDDTASHLIGPSSSSSSSLPSASTTQPSFSGKGVAKEPVSSLTTFSTDKRHDRMDVVDRQNGDEYDWASSLQSPETIELDELDDLFDAY